MTSAVDLVSPIGDSSQPRRLTRIVAWVAGTALALVSLDLLGLDIRGFTGNQAASAGATR